MSTQSIRSIIINQISFAISNSEEIIREEGRKKVEELKNEIPSSPEELVNRLIAIINPNTCSEKGKTKFEDKIKNELQKLENIDKPLKDSQYNLDRIYEKLNDILGEDGAAGIINSIASALEPVTEALKSVLSVSPIALASQVSVPGAGGPVNGLVISQLIDKIDFGKAKIKEIDGLVKSIPNMLNFYKDQAQGLVDNILTLKGKIQRIRDEIQKFKLIILALKLKFEKDCEDFNSSGNTGTNNTGQPGNTTGLPPDNFKRPTYEDIKKLTESLYGQIMDDLIKQGNTKAIERIYTLTKDLTEGYNISFKIVKI